jgi:hypothetical protein
MLSSTTRRSAGALVAATAALVVAAPTHAVVPGAPSPDPSQKAGASLVVAGKPGSIVFVRDHDVWLSRPDGTDLHRVTHDGSAATPYQSPSQSDTGLIAVGHGPEIKLLQQNGELVRRMDPGPLTSGVSHPLDGPPVNVAISPDGSKVAYTLASYQCPVAAPCGAQRATAVTHTDALTPPAVHGQTHYWDPSWIGNGRMVQSGGYLHQVSLVDLGAAPVHWFDDVDLPEVPYGTGTDLADAEVSPDGRWLGAVRGYGAGAHVVHYRVDGDVTSGPPPVVPDWLCATSELGGLGSPTFSPDSTTMMWHEPDGLWALPSLGEPCSAPQLVVPHASQPDWSAAPVSPGAGAEQPGRTTFTGSRRPVLKGVKQVGAKLRVRGSWTPRPARVRHTWLRNGKRIKGATGRTYRLRRADAGKRISVRLKLTAPGVTTAVLTSRKTKKVRR